jgi:NADH:ubiquinone oxidoreductase subunit B-like Fe-S oxidoreductase
MNSFQYAAEVQEGVQRNVLLSRLQDLWGWDRKNPFWPFNFGLSRCYGRPSYQHYQQARCLTLRR